MSVAISEFRSGGVSVVQDCSKNGRYEEYFRDGSIFSTSVLGVKELKVVVPSGTSLTITTASRELSLSSGTCTLKYKRHEDDKWLLLCNLQGQHPVTGLGLTCIGPDVFYLEAKGTKINVFGSVSTVAQETIVQAQALPKVAVVAMSDSDVPTNPNSSCVVVEQDRSSNGLFQESFAPGIVFATAVQGTNSMKVRVPTGTSLTLSTASRELSSGTCKLHYKGSDPDAEWHLLCKLHDEHSVTSLGITTIGPSEFYLKAPGTKINVFGSVSAASPAVHHVSSLQGLPAEIKASENMKKRSHEEQEGKDVAMEDTEEPPQLSKKQRRKLAKKKSKELADAVATLNMHSSVVEGTNGAQQPGKKPRSFTKERRLPSGVTVKDLMLGTGGVVKAGRKVSIIYEGSFPDGNVFDRNKNKNSPLTFRLGTGAVVRGLEHGLEGMKVGGEREITIPPNLGYGKKGSGNVVPPNSTLVFSVQVISAGSS